MKLFYQWPEFHMAYDPSNGAVVTHYANDRWSGCAPVPEDTLHGDRLGISPEEHRLAHEVAHHLVGIHVLDMPSSPVIYRDAHHIPQPEPDPAHEEWMVTALTYHAFGRPVKDWGALLDISKKADANMLAALLLWLVAAPHGSTVVVPPMLPDTI